MRMLIVEDEVFISMDLELQLTELGHEVLGIAASKDAAIETARTTKPDLALVDLHLAGPSSGLEAAKIMRAELNIPSILVSGSLHELLNDDLEKIAPVALLAKPFSPTKLAETLRDVSISG